MFASQTLPKCRRTVVFSTVGGWGILEADAWAEVGLDLFPHTKELIAEIDKMVPAR